MRVPLPVWNAVVLTVYILLSPGARGSGFVTNTNELAFQQALAGGGIVSLQFDGTLTFTSTKAIVADTTLDGTGRHVILSGGNKVRLFTVTNGATLTLSNLTLADGRANGNGGAILNSGQLAPSGCVFSNNLAIGADGSAGPNGANEPVLGGGGGAGGVGQSAGGGAIYNAGTVTALACTFVTNRAVGGNGGAGGNGGGGLQGGAGGNGGDGGTAVGGAIYNAGALSVANNYFTLNTAQAGSGGAGGTHGGAPGPNSDGNGGSGNAASGGAIYSIGSDSIGGCTFYGNTAISGNSSNAASYTPGPVGTKGKNGSDGFGGALALAGTNSMLNCTFATNEVSGGAGGNGGNASTAGGAGGNGGNAWGGSLYCFALAPNQASTFVTNCTFAGGRALPGQGGASGNGAIPPTASSPGAGKGDNVAVSAGNLALFNSLLTYPTSAGNAYGNIIDGRYNLSSDATPASFSSASRKLNLILQPLNFNGGPTPTMALAPPSPALDVIPPQDSPSTDQRGIPRPINGRGDVGAYEYEFAGPPVFITEPIAQTVSPSASAIFSATVAGAGPLTFLWYFDGIALTSSLTNSPQSGVVTNWITLTNVQRILEGNYSVEITNSAGSIMSGAVLLQVAPDNFAIQTIQTLPAAGQTNFSLTFPTVLGFSYTIEYKNALTDPIWTPLGVWFGTGNSVTSSPPNLNPPTGFYRIRAY